MSMVIISKYVVVFDHNNIEKHSQPDWLIEPGNPDRGYTTHHEFFTPFAVREVFPDGTQKKVMHDDGFGEREKWNSVWQISDGDEPPKATLYDALNELARRSKVKDDEGYSTLPNPDYDVFVDEATGEQMTVKEWKVKVDSE